MDLYNEWGCFIFAVFKCVLRQNRVRYWLYLIDFCRNF